MWAVICSLRHNWTVSAGRKGSLYKWLCDAWGWWNAFPRPETAVRYLLWYSPSESALRLLSARARQRWRCSLSWKKKKNLLSPAFLFPGIRKWSGDVTSLFADILFAAGCTEGPLFFRVCEPPKYLHAESQLHSMRRKTSKAWVQNSGFIGLCNHPRSFLVPLRLWRCVCVLGRTDFWTPVPLLPNDEQGWLWLRRGVRCQLLVWVRLASRRLEAWHRCPLSGGLRSHSHTENTVHPCTGICSKHPPIFTASFTFCMLILLKSCRLLVSHTHMLTHTRTHTEIHARSWMKGQRKPRLVSFKCEAAPCSLIVSFEYKSWI